MASRVPKPYLRFSAPVCSDLRRKVARYADLLSGLAPAALAVSLITATGCGNELPPETRGRGGPQRGGKPVKVAPTDPLGGYFVSVDAKGTGCPPGSWTTDVSSDGQVFSTNFSAYEVQVEPTDRMATNDCAVTIKMHTPQGISFTVTSLSYTGYGLLDPGLRGSFSARYGFRGIDAGRSYREESGPYDGPFAFEDRVQSARAVWSPCGKDHELTVRTQLTLNNGQPAGSGYANLLALEGSTNLVLGVSWRRCQTGR